MGYRAIIREIRIKNFRSIVEATNQKVAIQNTTQTEVLSN